MPSKSTDGIESAEFAAQVGAADGCGRRDQGLARLLSAAAVMEAAEDQKSSGICADRHVDFWREPETVDAAIIGRQDSDDRVQAAVQLHRFTDCGRIGAHSSAPERVADHRDIM